MSMRLIKLRPLSRRAVRYVFGLILLLLLVIGYFSINVLRSMVEDARQVSQSREVLVTIKDMGSDLLTAESSTRGYVITRDTSFRDEYASARDSVLSALDTLRTYLMDDSLEQGYFAIIDTLVKERFLLLDSSLHHSGLDSSGREKQIHLTSYGNDVSGRITSVLDALWDEEQSLLRVREVQWHTTSRNTIFTILAAALIIVLLFTLIFLLLNRHISELEGKEDSLRTRSKELIKANKELESFSYSVSHDLKAPLRAMMGFSSLLMEETAQKLTAQENEYLTFIAQSADNMGRLIEELLTFFRLNQEPLSRKEVDCKSLVEELVSIQRQAAPDRSVKVVVHDLPPIQADPTLLRQVWENVITNAFKFTRGKGQEASIEIGAEKKDGETVYYIKDNGTGFDMKYYNKLFGVFQRLHSLEEYEGTGIGLAFTQRIIQRHGGRIWAEAKPEKGATFYFSLPA